MIDEVVLESILDMSDEEFSEALETLSNDEIDSLCEALEGLSSADKKSIRDFGRGIGSGSIKGSPEQDRNHEAVYNAAMNKVNTFQGKDRDKALKALKKGVKKGIGGNIFTRGKRADALLSNMQNSSNFHKEQDKTRELNNQLQNRINSFNTAKEDVNMFNYSEESIEALEGVLLEMADMSDEELDAVAESLDADEIMLIDQYLSDREDVMAVESIISALADMDDDEYTSAMEAFTEDELDYLIACEGLGNAIAKVGMGFARAEDAFKRGNDYGKASGRKGYGMRKGWEDQDSMRQANADVRHIYRETGKNGSLGRLYDLGNRIGRFTQNRKDEISAAGRAVGKVAKPVVDKAKQVGSTIKSDIQSTARDLDKSISQVKTGLNIAKQGLTRSNDSFGTNRRKSEREAKALKKKLGL